MLRRALEKQCGGLSSSIIGLTKKSLLPSPKRERKGRRKTAQTEPEALKPMLSRKESPHLSHPERKKSQFRGRCNHSVTKTDF